MQSRMNTFCPRLPTEGMKGYRKEEVESQNMIENDNFC